MSNDLSGVVLGALLLTMAGHVLAAETKPSNTDGITVGELSRVQSETILYKAEGERAKALRELNNGGAQSVSAPQLGYLPPPMATQTGRLNAGEPADAVEQLPVVKLIYGAGKALHATLLYPGGVEVDASPASTDLPGGYRVASLNLDSVVLSRGGKRYPLGFSNRAPSYPVATAATGRASVLPIAVTPMNPPPPASVPAPTPIALPGSTSTGTQP